MYEQRTKLESQLTAEIRNRIIYKALLTRRVEELLLKMYSTGELFGTIHTCIGQEFVGAIVNEFLKPGDTVFSNHRCHGHYIAFSEDVKGLIAEIYGKKIGVCGGKGGSQHLCQNGFYSNGVQGGIVPIAAGLALTQKLRQQNNIQVVFIGDGTLGEGVLYETLNLSSKWQLPLVFILENNFYAQSTHQSEVMAGDICARAQSFAIKTLKASTWEWEKLYDDVNEMIYYTRIHSQPCFIQIDTYRLQAHSKGDDNRDPEEVKSYFNLDPLNKILRSNHHDYVEMENKINELLAVALNEAKSAMCDTSQPSLLSPITWDLNQSTDDKSSASLLGTALNQALHDIMAANEQVYFMGEDVKSPYGGAFKIAKGLSDSFPEECSIRLFRKVRLSELGQVLLWQVIVR